MPHGKEALFPKRSEAGRSLEEEFPGGDENVYSLFASHPVQLAG